MKMVTYVVMMVIFLSDFFPQVFFSLFRFSLEGEIGFSENILSLSQGYDKVSKVNIAKSPMTPPGWYTGPVCTAGGRGGDMLLLERIDYSFD